VEQGKCSGIATMIDTELREGREAVSPHGPRSHEELIHDVFI
jgi:hypothetical protein